MLGSSLKHLYSDAMRKSNILNLVVVNNKWKVADVSISSCFSASETKSVTLASRDVLEKAKTSKKECSRSLCC